MKKGLIFLSLVLLSFSLLSISLISGFHVTNGVTWRTPVASGTVAGTYMLNVTNTTTFNEPINCSFYAKSASTSNSSWSLIGFAYNTTASGINNFINVSILSKYLEDATDYQLNATCRNITNDSTSVVVSSIVVDSYIPVAPTSLYPSDATSLTSATTVYFSASVNDSQTTTCSHLLIRSKDGGQTTDDIQSGTSTYSTTNCSFSKTFSATADNGHWCYYINATDGTNVTASSTNCLDFKYNEPGAGGGGGTPYVTPPTPVTNVNNVPSVSFMDKIGAFFSKIADFFKGIFGK